MCRAYGKENHFPPELAYYDWITFSDGDIHNFGRFLRTFQSLEEAKEYAMYYANVNSGGINRKNNSETGRGIQNGRPCKPHCALRGISDVSKAL